MATFTKILGYSKDSKSYNNIACDAGGNLAISGLKFNTDGELLVSGTGGGGSGDASSALQQEQIDIATASNTAIWQQLSDQTDRILIDTNIIANSINYSNVAITARLDNIDVSTNNMEIQLDKLTFTSSNLHVRDDRVLTELQSSNLAQYTKLGLIAEATEDTLLSVDGINTKLSPIKSYQSKYNIEAATLLESPGQNPSYTTPPSSLGIPASEGYYYKNSILGASQLYYYSWLNLAAQPAAQTKPFRLDSITNSYAVLRVGNVDTSASIPFIGIYTRPQGVGDYAPFYRSRRVYTLPAQSLTQGMKFMIWWGLVEPSEKLFPGITRIQANLTLSNGPQLGSELVAFMSVNSDSGAALNKVEYIVSGAGWQVSAPGLTEEYTLTFSGESSSTTNGNATASNQVASNTAICARLDSANLTITNSNLALASRLTTLSSNIGQLYYTGSNLLVQDQKLSSELSSLNSTIGQGIYVNMETDPVVSGGVKLHGTTDGNLFVYDAQSNTTLGLIYDEAFATNGVLSDLVSGTSQLYVRIDGTDDSIQIMGWNATSSMPEQIYSVDNSAKVYVDNVVNSLLLAKNSVLNNVNLIVDDTTQRLLTKSTIDNTVSVTGSVSIDNYPYSQNINGSVSVSNFPSSTQISGGVSIDNWPYSQNINGSVSVSNFPQKQSVFIENTTEGFDINTHITNTSLDVSGSSVSISNFPYSQIVSGSVSIDNYPYSQNINGSVSVSNFPQKQSVFIENTTEGFDINTHITNSSLAVTGDFYPTTQPISIAAPVDVHMYANGSGGSMHLVSCDSSGKLNVSLHDNSGNGLTSTSINSFRALDVSCKGNVAANLATLANGSLTSTLSGSGNSVNSLDVAVKNNLSIQNVPSTTLAINSVKYGSWGNVYNNQTTVLVGAASTALDVSNWAYFMGYYTDANSSAGTGTIKLQYSFDNITFYDIFGTIITPSGTGTRTANIFKQDLGGIKYIRMLNNTTVNLVNVNLTLFGASN